MKPTRFANLMTKQLNTAPIVLSGSSRSPIFLAALCAFVWAAVAVADVPAEVRNSIDRITGAKGSYIANEGVYRVSFARADVRVLVGRRSLSPSMGLSSWAAFASNVHHEALLTGQLVLFDDEVNPVLSVVLDNGLEATGLGSLFLFEQPRVMSLDIMGVGDFQKLAFSFRKALDQIRKQRAASPQPRSSKLGSAVPDNSNIDPGPLNAVLSMNGEVRDGVYRAAIGRKAIVRGEQIGREMGISTRLVIAGTNKLALAEGQFVATAGELQSLLKILRSSGIDITSIRNRTIGEHPQFIFVHFWGQGEAIALAKHLRHALNVQVGETGEKI